MQHPFRTGVLGALAVALVTILAVGLMSVSAVHDEALLELDTVAGDVGECTAGATGRCGDGNVADDSGAGAPVDWASLCDASMNKITPASGAPNQHTCVRDFDTPDGTYFDSEKDIYDITEWECKSHNNPLPKNEIFNAYSALFTDTSGGDAGNQVLYVGFERETNNGNSFMGFWFLQEDTGCVHPTGTSGTTEFSGAGHVNGDLLILSNFTGGGRVSTIDVFYWCPSGTSDPFMGGTCAPGSTDPLAPLGQGADCADEFSGGTPLADDVCGVVNQTCLLTPWPPADQASCTTGANGQNKPVLDSNQFFEAGIDLNAVGIPSPLPCFSTFLAETRSSQEVTATTKDYALGSFEVCGKITIEKQTDPDGAPGTFTFSNDIPDCSPSFTLMDDGTKVCDDITPDEYLVTESDPTTLTPPFDLVDIQCAVDVDGGTSYVIGRDVSGSFDNGGSDEYDAGDDRVKITIGTLGEVTCTFFNRQRGTIFIEKVDEEGDPLADACFTIDPDPKDLDGTREVCDNGADDEDSRDGIFCVEDVVFGGGTTFTVSETTVPAGYEGADPQMITVSDTTTCAEREAGGGSLLLTFVNKLGTILIHKVSAKTGNPEVGGACFDIEPDPSTGTGSFTLTVCDRDGATGDANDTDDREGFVCVEGVPLDDYKITESTVPTNYKGDTPKTVTVSDSSTCAERETAGGAAVVTFVNIPLSKFQILFHNLTGETAADISCTDLSPTPDDSTPGEFDDLDETYGDGTTTLEPGVYNCTINIDP